MSRYIDADAVKNIIRSGVSTDTEDDQEYVCGLIDEAPTIDAIPIRPQGEWIPCSERLPQYRDVVLISTFWGVRVAERDGIKEDGTDDFWYLFLNDATAHPRYVYAWMPLPEPWKGADDETD